MVYNYAELDVLLTLQQYRMAVPDTLACYLPYGMYIIFETVSLPVDRILGLCTKPLSLVRWDDSTNTMLHLSEPVSMYYRFWDTSKLLMLLYMNIGMLCISESPSPARKLQANLLSCYLWFYSVMTQVETRAKSGTYLTIGPWFWLVYLAMELPKYQTFIFYVVLILCQLWR